MLDADALLAAYDDQLRPAEVSRLPPGVRAEVDGPVVRVVGRVRGFIGAPAEIRLDPPDLDALIARQRDYFAARGEAVEWKTYGHDRPADLPDRLAAAGFRPEDQETVVIGLAGNLVDEPPLPEPIVIREVTDEVDLRRIAAMKTVVWGADFGWLADELLAEIRHDPQHITVLAAEAGGEIVSAAWLRFNPGTEFAGLWGGATLASWRRRGIYRALVARRARLAVARGVRYLQVDASDDSRPILQRLGFVPVTTTTPYVWTPPA